MAMIYILNGPIICTTSSRAGRRQCNHSAMVGFPRLEKDLISGILLISHHQQDTREKEGNEIEGKSVWEIFWEIEWFVI